MKVEMKWVLGVAVAMAGGAWLSGSSARAADSAGSGHLLCRAFSAPVESGARIETSDKTSEAGQWVASETEKGWRVHSVQLALGQKPTGFPAGFAQVCLRR